MRVFTFSFWAAYEELGDSFLLGEVVGFPEVSRLGTDRAKVEERLRRNLVSLLEKAPLGGLHRRHIAEAPVPQRFTLTLEPVEGSVLWREPPALKFDVLRWSHGRAPVIGFVPALGIVVLAADTDQLEERLPHEIRAALSRARAASSLRQLVALTRVRER
jgi:hypothetical protein